MTSNNDPEPDPNGSVFLVGQDVAGHWLVQESGGRLEGRFISFAAAMSFARAERHAFHAALMVSETPLVPQVPFTPVSPGECALSHAA